ncbi:MAG: hypothetical protein WCH43_10830 [Verrucomicrobiota bacterium]
MKTRILAVVLLILAFGFARMDFEQKLTDAHRKAYFHGAKLNLDLRQKVGQLGFLAALSGFRSIVADLLWIKAHTEWEKTEWGTMALLFNTVTALQPRNVMFWEMSAWHMAWNASLSALQDPKQPSMKMRLKAQREYFDLGRDFLIRGIQNNPDRYKLYEQLAYLYKEKYGDHCAAAEQYEKAAQFPDAPTYMKRFGAYELAACPGHEKEAYEKLHALFKEGESQWLPTLLKDLKELEVKLDIPADQRIKVPAGFK